MRPRLETFEITNSEQLRAFASPVHNRILKIMAEKGACTIEELSRYTKYSKQEIEDYIIGLVSVGIMEEVDIKGGKPCYLPVAKFFNINKEVLATPEGLEALRELLLERLAAIAQTAVTMKEDIYSHGDINLVRYKFNEEDFKWAKQKLKETFRELSKRSEETSGDDIRFYEATFILNPIPRETED